MVRKRYEWGKGVKLLSHTKKKHIILEEYFRDYLMTRCTPLVRNFRIIVVDGFAGAGMYEDGSYGSPLIFISVLNEFVVELNVKRHSDKLPPITIECSLYLNDIDLSTVELLKANIANYSNGHLKPQQLKLDMVFTSYPFEEFYSLQKNIMKKSNCVNVFFNLDQCGYSAIPENIIKDIMKTWRSAEVILTFMIDSLITYLSPKKDNTFLPISIKRNISALNDKYKRGEFSHSAWLGLAERTIFENLRSCAPFVSPFSINNPDGWRYWLMHFANFYRARQVFNDVLHKGNATQIHCGRAGLDMLSYDPRDEQQLYLFDNNSRDASKDELYNDIPHFLSSINKELKISDFYYSVYNQTPAHSDDINKILIEHPDIEIITELGGERRKSHTIKNKDILRLKKQKSFFFMFD